MQEGKATDENLNGPLKKCDRQENKGDPGAQQHAASRQGK